MATSKALVIVVCGWASSSSRPNSETIASARNLWRTITSTWLDGHRVLVLPSRKDQEERTLLSRIRYRQDQWDEKPKTTEKVDRYLNRVTDENDLFMDQCAVNSLQRNKISVDQWQREMIDIPWQRQSKESLERECRRNWSGRFPRWLLLITDKQRSSNLWRRESRPEGRRFEHWND